MDVINNNIEKTRARKLGRGSIRLQRGLFATSDVWAKRRKMHDSNVLFVDNFFKNYKKTKQHKE